eukprot:GGOE01019460.1.p1 GENE.GGOE01019460.1~~GGOE01019460.1.p1  ORF type:complete len:757 (+),score=202.90 GGOE01019460.1:195-2273(+)
MCKGCKAVLNPHCRVDWTSKLWICPFCLTRNQLPPQYQSVTQELLPQFGTVEYEIHQSAASPPVFFFCIDTSIPVDELESLKDSLLQSFSLLPEDALVGLITFGSTVTIWELGFTELHKSYVLGGHKEYTLDQVSDYLQIRPAQFLPGQAPQSSLLGRFLALLSDCELNLTSIVEELSPDPWPTKQDERPLHCTGCALDIAQKMLQLSGINTGGRILLFAGGAITKGPGQIVTKDLNDSIRSHNDIRTDEAPLFAAAVKFYEGIAERLVKFGFACDVFAGCLDQVGIAELSCCCTRTGGFLLMVDTFKTPVFKATFQRFFKMNNNDCPTVFNATLEIQTSRGTKVAGIIGPCTSLKKMSPCVSETEVVGQGHTCAWQMSVLMENTTFGVYLDVCGTPQEAPERYIQFITSYQTSKGSHRLRVTTISHPITPGAEPKFHVGRGAFDQDAAAVLAARMAVDLLEKNSNDVNEVMRWLDRSVITLVKRFGTYTPDDPTSLRLESEFTLFPVFMYHLRRSGFLQIFNSSPDETTFFRATLIRENCSNSIIMIQPTLHSYSFTGPPQAVLLDSNSVLPDNILLLDTFFDVVIHHGMTIAAWQQQKYHEMPEHVAFKNLLQAPKVDAERLMSDRFPHPKYTECNQNGSQARILLNRLNPSVSYTSQQYGQAPGQVVLTDDANLQTFMTHLKRLAVASS